MPRPSSRLSLRLAGAAALAAVALAGCGSTPATSKKTQTLPAVATVRQAAIRATVLRFDAAERSGDVKTVCALMTPAGKKSLIAVAKSDLHATSRTCTAAFRALSKGSKLDDTATQFRDSVAHATVTFQTGGKATLKNGAVVARLTGAASTWLLASLAS